MAGYIQVITGSMFSGKSQELSRLIERALIAQLSVAVFYPRLASRGSARDIEKRLQGLNGTLQIFGVPAENAQSMLAMITSASDVVAIDEA